MFDGKAFGEEMVAIVKGYVERKLGPVVAENEALRQRIAVLEERSAAAVMIYRGIHNDQQRYAAGDTVTWGGSCWHCNEATADRPGGGSKAWTLMVKRGADAKGATA